MFCGQFVEKFDDVIRERSCPGSAPELVVTAGLVGGGAADVGGFAFDAILAWSLFGGAAGCVAAASDAATTGAGALPLSALLA